VPPPWQTDPALGSLVVAEDELQAVVRSLGERISATTPPAAPTPCCAWRC